MGFFLDDKVLYKKGKDQVLLRCVDSSKASKIVGEINEGICGTHANGHRMVGQVMRAGYYWLTLERDCIQYAWKCHECQIYSDKIHVPPTELHVMAPFWPFSMWGMDVIGPITPKASNGHRFIYVVIDYFWLFHEMGRSNIICQHYSIGDLPFHQEKDYMPIQDFKKDHFG